MQYLKGKNQKRSKILLFNRKKLDFQKVRKCYKISLDNIIKCPSGMLWIFKEEKVGRKL